MMILGYRLKIQIKITVWAMETAFGAFTFGMRCGFVGEIYEKTSWMECSRCDSARAFSWQIPDGPAPLSYVKKNRDGCYDNQFVISEVNADIKLFARKKRTSEEFKQHDSNYAVDPFGDEMNTVGVLITTSKLDAILRITHLKRVS